MKTSKMAIEFMKKFKQEHWKPTSRFLERIIKDYDTRTINKDNV